MRSLIETISVNDIRPEIKQMKAALTGVAKEAYIFGSAAIGAAVKGESDVDLLVVPKRSMTIHDAYKKLDKVLFQLLDKGVVLHVVIYDAELHEKDLLEKARKGYKLI